MSDNMQGINERINAIEKTIRSTITTMVKAHDRIHALPRATDTKLAREIEKAIGDMQKLLSDNK
jgi:hypothetical protein